MGAAQGHLPIADRVEARKCFTELHTCGVEVSLSEQDIWEVFYNILVDLMEKSTLKDNLIQLTELKKTTYLKLKDKNKRNKIEKLMETIEDQKKSESSPNRTNY